MHFVRPQLAKPATDRSVKALGNSYVMEIKLDGHRRLMGRDVAWSRIGKDHSHPDIQKQLPEGWLFDGEIVPTDCPASSNVVSHYLAECPEKLKFVAFDLLWTSGNDIQDQDWVFRRAILEGFFSTHPNLERFEMSKVYYPKWTPLEEVIEIAAADNYEGVMLKKYLAPYKPNSRSAWQKYKFVETFDVVVTDCESKPTQWRVRPGDTGKDGVFYPNGRHSDPWLKGYVGLSYGMYDTGGKLRRIGSLGATGKREDMEQYVGRVVEVKSYGPQYPTGALRHPTVVGWREDKDATDCVFCFGDEK
jgi:ATP-dependent DNA ligase